MMERSMSQRPRFKNRKKTVYGRLEMPTQEEIHPFFNARKFFNGLFGKQKDGKSYLIISGGDKCSEVSCASPKTKTECVRVIEIDGVPHTVLFCRSRYVRALQKCELASTTFASLSQFLTSEDIKRFFNSVWCGWHNEMAKKRLATEISEHNHKVKTGEWKPPTRDELFIRGITSGMSMRSAAWCSRGL